MALLRIYRALFRICRAFFLQICRAPQKEPCISESTATREAGREGEGEGEREGENGPRQKSPIYPQKSPVYPPKGPCISEGTAFESAAFPVYVYAYILSLYVFQSLSPIYICAT